MKRCGRRWRVIPVMPDAPIRLSRETMGEVPHGIPRPDNANYLWIQLFHSTLNETGRAGFVMANSAATRGAASR